MEVEINAWAVILAAVSAMVIGAVWYAKSLFGKEWMKLAKVKEADAKANAGKAMTRGAVAALLTAYILAHSIEFAVNYFPERGEVSVGLSTAVFIWLGYFFANTLMQDGFEGRALKLTMINVGYSLAMLLAMGWIIASVTY